jgi:hypothetical protein
MAFEHTVLLILQALCLAAAAVGLAVTDWSLNKPDRWSQAATQMASHMTIAALCVLWSTALLMLWQDLGLALLTTPVHRKALTSLALATLLSLNGVFMLRCLRDTLRSGPAALVAVITRATALAQACGGAWLLAGYFAIAHPLTGQWGLSGLALALAALLVLGSLAVKRLMQRLAATQTPWQGRAG